MKEGRALLLVACSTALARCLVLAAYTTIFWPTLVVAHLIADLRTWPLFFFRVRAGLVPYVDFPKEYPVGAGLLYTLLAPFVDPRSLRQFTQVHGLFMGAGDVLGAIVFYQVARSFAPRFALALTLIFSLNLTALLLSPLRFESWVVLVTLLGYAYYRRGAPLRSTLLLSVGCALKWFPIFLILAKEWQELHLGGRRQWLASSGVFLGVLFVLNAPFAAADFKTHGNLQNFLSPYVFHVRRPLYWDTLLGVAQLWLGPLSFERYGSLWTLGLVLLMLLIYPRMALERKATLMIIAALLVNRVYSAQFNLWFYPFLLLSMVREDGSLDQKLLMLFGALDLVNVFVYPFGFAKAYSEVGDFQPWAGLDRGGFWTVAFSAAIVARALLLVMVALRILVEKAPRTDPRAPDLGPPLRA